MRTSSFAGSGDCDVRSRDFLFRPCSAPVISAGFPGLRAVCRFLHPPAPIYRDLQGLLWRWPFPTPDLNLNGTRVLWRLDVAFVRSSVAHGRIRHLHIPDQHRHAVFTAKDLGDVKPIAAAAALSGFKHCREPILAVDKVRYVGELIAAIRVLHMETPSPHTEFGVKGIGEGGAVGPRCCNSQRRE